MTLDVWQLVAQVGVVCLAQIVDHVAGIESSGHIFQKKRFVDERVQDCDEK